MNSSENTRVVLDNAGVPGFTLGSRFATAGDAGLGAADFVFVALDVGSGVDVEGAPTGIVLSLAFFVDEVETIEIVITVPSVTSKTADMAIAPLRNRPCFTETFLR
ncbi:MAG: hypothetical protein H7279_04155 [Microbacteriaceae bacterium]|nr:hypothetical protein [Microbacteriaceae bacterium]